MNKGPYFSILVGIGVFSGQAEAGNWPAWRGDGSGVTKESNLPTQWSEEHNILWKTPLTGSGISSPIIWNDRVFITAAVEGKSPSVVKTTATIIGISLLVVASISALWRRRSTAGGQRSERSPVWLRRIHALDRVAVAIVFLSFVASVVSLLLLRDQVLEMGRVSRTWVASGVCGMLGLVAAVGCFPIPSISRKLGAIVLVVAAPTQMPHSKPRIKH